MKIRTTFFTNLAIMALAACLPLGTAAWANSIPGTSLTPTVWWSADAANNVTNNGLVSQLTDQSGNGNNAVQDTQNAAALPIFTANAINGLPTLSFGGTNCLISPTGGATGNPSHTMLMVASYTPVNNNYRNGGVFYSDTAGSAQNSCLGVNPNGGFLWVGGYNQDNGSPYVGTLALNGAGFNILSKVYTASSASYQGYVSGVLDCNGTGFTYNLGNTRVGLGKQFNNGSYWGGNIAEVIVFNSALSFSDLQAVQQYLANKYNLPLALPAISITASTPYVAVGSNVVVTVSLPAFTTTTTVTITSDNPSVTGFSSTNLTFALGSTNVQTFVAKILAVGTAHLTASNPSFNNGTLAVGGLAPATIIEDYQASSLPSLNGGVAVNNGDPITAWAGETNSSWVWTPNAGGVDPTFQAQATRALTPAIDFQGGSLGIGGGTSGLVVGRTNFSVALVFQAAAVGVGNSGDQWGNQTGIIDDAPTGGGVSGNYFGISISSSGEISAGLGSAANTTTICRTNYNLVGSTYHVAVASYDVLNGQIRLTVDDQPTVTSSGSISSGTLADLDLTLGGSSAAATRYFSGAIAETRYYDGALTVAEATNLIHTLKTNYSILYPSQISVSLTPATTILDAGSNAVLTLSIPQAANASQPVSVTVTNKNPGVISLQGAVGNILTVTFPAGATNAQSVVVTGVVVGQASLTYASASPGLVPAGPAIINVVMPNSMIGHWLSGSQSFADASGYMAPGIHDGVPTGANYYWTNDVPTNRSGYSLAFPAINPDTVILITNTWDTLSADPGYQPTFDADVVNAISVALWAKGFPGQWNSWMSKWGENYTGPNGGWQLRQFNASGQSCFTVRGAQTAGDLEASTNSNDGNWHYYVGTYDAQLGLQSIYVDGVLSGQGNVTGSWTPTPYEPMIICGRSNGDGTPTSMATYGEEITSAEVYDIRIYNYALGPSQVSQLYSGIAPAPTLGVTRSGSSLVLTWQAGSTLLQATNLLGPWTTNVNTSPYTVTPTGPQMFFRAQAP